MKVEYGIEGWQGFWLDKVPVIARQVEELGFEGMVTTEAAHDPFFPLAFAAEHSRRLTLATSVAIAFARSPFVTAQIAWDLQALSKGRLLLGLGTQVKGHNERRFSVPWGPPGPRLREYVLALRAIWDCFQNNTKLDFRGQYYTHTVMTPVFNPGPIEHPNIPVYISAINPYNCRLVGEICDGVRLHPISSPRYISEVILPNIAQGATKTGRTLAEIDVVCSPLIATGRDEKELAASFELARKRVGYYAATRTYMPPFELQGWEETVQRCIPLSLQGKWDALEAEITDEMVRTFAVVGTRDVLAERIRQFCPSGVTTVRLQLPLRNDEDAAVARQVVRDLKS